MRAVNHRAGADAHVSCDCPEIFVDGRGFTANIARLTLVIAVTLIIETKKRNYGS
jgi:hypothetical protein